MIITVIKFMLLGICFWPFSELILTLTLARANMSLSRAQNIFIPANTNSTVYYFSSHSTNIVSKQFIKLVKDLFSYSLSRVPAFNSHDIQGPIHECHKFLLNWLSVQKKFITILGIFYIKINKFPLNIFKNHWGTTTLSYLIWRSMYSW